jgi:hypothetical protein
MALVQLQTFGLKMLLRAHFIGKTTPKHLHTSMRQLYRRYTVIFDGLAAKKFPGIRGEFAGSFSAQRYSSIRVDDDDRGRGALQLRESSHSTLGYGTQCIPQQYFFTSRINTNETL